MIKTFSFRQGSSNNVHCSGVKIARLSPPTTNGLYPPRNGDPCAPDDYTWVRGSLSASISQYFVIVAHH